MMAWVEQGTAPGQLVLTKFDSNGNATSSLPDCPYPTVPHYSGSGSVSAAASYTCATS